MAGRRPAKPVTGAERKAMRLRAAAGASAAVIMREFGRPESTVRTHCAGVLPVQAPAAERLIAILEIAERSTVSRSVLASDLGFANANSLGVILTRARRARREAAACV